MSANQSSEPSLASDSINVTNSTFTSGVTYNSRSLLGDVTSKYVSDSSSNSTNSSSSSSDEKGTNDLFHGHYHKNVTVFEGKTIEALISVTKDGPRPKMREESARLHSYIIMVYDNQDTDCALHAPHYIRASRDAAKAERDEDAVAKRPWRRRTSFCVAQKKNIPSNILPFVTHLPFYIIYNPGKHAIGSIPVHSHKTLYSTINVFIDEVRRDCAEAFNEPLVGDDDEDDDSDADVAPQKNPWDDEAE